MTIPQDTTVQGWALPLRVSGVVRYRRLAADL